MKPASRLWKRVKQLLPFSPIIIVPAAYLFVFWPTVYSAWIHGWGDVCNASDIYDSPSPSGQWIARSQVIGCSVLAGSMTQDVVLVPARPLFPLLAREHPVFSEDIVDRTINVSMHWKDDHTLEIAASGCGEPCGVFSPVKGITIHLRTEHKKNRGG